MSKFLRSRTSSFGSDGGFLILKSWFTAKNTKDAEVAFGNMAKWGRSTPSGKEFTEYLWLASQFVRDMPTLLLNPTETNAMFEKLHTEDIISLRESYRMEAKRWSSVLRKGLAKYRECAKYAAKTQTALRRCSDQEKDDLLRFFYLVDTEQTPERNLSHDTTLAVVYSPRDTQPAHHFTSECTPRDFPLQNFTPTFQKFTAR